MQLLDKSWVRSFRNNSLVTPWVAAATVVGLVCGLLTVPAVLAETGPESGAEVRGLTAQSIAARARGVGPEPSRIVKIDAEIHQDRSSHDRPYTVFEYQVPTEGAVPHILAIDKDDQVFFSESGGRFARNFIDRPAMNKIGRLDIDGTVSEWNLATEGSSPMGVVFDQNDDLWIAERLGNRITRYGRDGRVTSYDIPTPGAWPTGIDVDSKGRVWFTETKGDKIAHVDPATGKIHEFPLPGGKKIMATGLAVDHQDRVWVAMRDVATIGRYDSRSGEWTRFPLATPESKPCGVMVDGEGQLWFSQRNAGKIGRILEDGTIEEFSVGNNFSGPFIMVADKVGDIWFSQLFSGEIGRFDRKTRTFEHFDLPGEDTYPAGIALDSKGNLWYAQQANDRIGVIVRTDLGYMVSEDGSRVGQAKKKKRPGQKKHKIVEMDVPTAQAIPGIVGVDRNDTVWFTQMGGGWVGPGFPPGPPGSRIGYVKDGKIGELETPTPESGPTSMAMDPCSDDVWITLRAANKIARVRDFEVREFDVPLEGNALPVGIAVDLDHHVWVAFSEANKLGRRSPEGDWKFLDIPIAGAEPRTIYVDPDNEVWFAEKTGNHVGWVDKKNWRLERWEIPTRLAWPLSLTSDTDGNLWFAQMRSDKLAMLDRETKEITEYELPVQSAPFKILYDSNNNSMWISTVFYNSILRFDLDRKELVEIYKVPSEGAWVGGLDHDSSGCIWFSEQFANKIGKICIDGVTSPDRSHVFPIVGP